LREYVWNIELSYENNIGYRIIHALATDGPNELHDAYYWVHIMCKKMFILLIINSHTFQYSMQPDFSALVIIEAIDDSDQNTNTESTFKWILLKFQYTKEKNDMCKGELLELTETLQHEFENKMIFEA
jgi:hypothetical protein